MCKRCGHNLTPRRYGGRRPDAYTCQVDGGGRCGGVGISLAKLDAFVEEAVLGRLDTPAMRRAIARRPRRRRDVEDPAVLQADLETLADAAGRGEISVAEYLAARRPLEKRLDVAQRALVDDDSRALAPIASAPDVGKAWGRLDLDGKRAVLAALIDTITVAPANGATTFQSNRALIDWKV